MGGHSFTMVMTAIRKNPYIIGRPINEPDRFFNREDLLEFVAENLNQGARAIVLYGQRRIGKSSVLAQLPFALAAEPYTFIQLSLEGKSQKPLPLILHELSKEALYDLEHLNQVPIVPSVAEFEAAPEIFVTQFLKKIHQLCDRQDVVLLLDEFDTLGGDYHPEVTHFFSYLQQFISLPSHQFSFLRIIPVIGRRLDDVKILSEIFHAAPTWEIRLLDRVSATKLIQEPAQGVLAYSSDAIEAILDLAAGHPYFTQVLGFAVFSYARQLDRWSVHARDIYAVVDRAIELAGGGLAWFWDGLPIAERVVYAAAAEIAAQGSGLVRYGEPLELLEDRGIRLTDCLHTAQLNLIDWKFLREITPSRGDGVQRGTYRIAIALVQQWLTQQHSIRDEIWQLQDLQPDLKITYEAARQFRHQGNITQAILFYERVYSENPNHLGTLFELADCCLQTQGYARALELYDRAYYVDPHRAYDGLIRAGLGHAQTLCDRGQLTDASVILSHLLDIDPKQTQVLESLAEITRRQAQKPPEQSWGKFIPDWKWNLSRPEHESPSEPLNPKQSPDSLDPNRSEEDSDQTDE